VAIVFLITHPSSRGSLWGASTAKNAWGVTRRRLLGGDLALLAGARYRWVAAHIMCHEGELRAWLRHYAHVLSASDIDDLVQEAYARLWEADLSSVANGRSYFYAVVRNLFLDQARRARTVPMERLGEIDALRIPSEDPGPDAQAGTRQELERLLRIIEGLPPQCRRAFRLQKFAGLSQREIAQEMRISEKTVEKHLASALLRVLEAVTRETGAAIPSVSRAEQRRSPAVQPR
jgi:RNA polymerase sigma factor (sigma-70 family)